ncbi:NACHT domain-containing protein [Umezawaea sp. NPDC059074]|uniref:NACHT domain-containing protein n=1 Tax=Umezawaea sp. NPDC059074 TaxID=3346716 RepID=UPI0036762E6A
MSIEAALISLGTVAVRTAAKLWLGDRKIAAEVTASAVDVLSGRLTKQLDQRKFNRMIDSFAEAVVERVEPIIDAEFRGLPENERLAAIDAVRDTFDQAPLVDADLFAADLDARHLDKSIRGRVPAQSKLLSADATALYDLLLRECCGYVIEISRGLPAFSSSALTELLRRDREILDGIRQVLARLPQRDRSADFDYDYRQLVARKLDQVEMFGVTLADASRRYPLSVAYISLTASSDELGQGSRVEELLAGDRRLFIRGEAGLGKTTLLHWIAVRSALGDFPPSLNEWNGTIPFFVPLRRYADRELPAPERFLDEVGRHISDEMPKGWVQQRLRDGRAVLLVDGVDELAPDRRDEVRSWLRDLVGAFPEARFVVTSRPGAAQPEWLHGEKFTVLDLQPMSPHDVRVFVERWHDAMRSVCVDDEAKAEIDTYQRGLTAQLDTRTHLRKLAGYPLLCALLCALHKDRRAALPNSRMELYDVALQMLLERRDNERGIDKLVGLDRTEKTLILGDFAYWLIRNGYSDAEMPQAIEQFDRKLSAMPQVEAGGREVYRHLLERSGLLREPVDGRVDFVHRTFQEYLAAGTAVKNADDIGVVVSHADLDQWHEVVVMAVGHASLRQREALFSGLLDRADNERENEDTLNLLALASLETATELGQALRSEIHRRAEALLPPKSLTAAKSFSSAGAFVIDLLAAAKPRTVKETVATIRAIADTGSAEAMRLLVPYTTDKRVGVQRELIGNWSKFDEEEYARNVLSKFPIVEITVHSPGELRGLKYLSDVRIVEITYQNEIDLALLAGFGDLSWLILPADDVASLDPIHRLMGKIKIHYRFRRYDHPKPIEGVKYYLKNPTPSAVSSR